MQATVNNTNQYLQNPQQLNRQAVNSNVNPSTVQPVQNYTQVPQPPTASVGAVQIFINNPTATAPGQYYNNNLAGQPIADTFVPTTNNTVAVPPVAAPVVTPPAIAPIPPKAAVVAPAVAPVVTPPVIAPIPPKAAVVAPAPQKPVAAQDIAPEKKVEEKKEEVKAEDTKKNEKKPSIPLTKEYIMTLENYIKNENPDIKLMGIKELLKRFKEDDTRKTNQALTSLLNYALQDDQQQIRLYSLMILDAGYAKGDDFTYKLLTNMQKSDKIFNQDSLTASQILLKRAGNNTLEKVVKPDELAYLERKNDGLRVENQTLKTEIKKAKEAKNPEVGKKLNLLAG